MVESGTGSTSSAEHGDAAAGSHAGGHPSSAVLFVAVALFIGIFTRNVMQSVPVPYTALLLVWGILIGVADSTFAQWEHMGSAIELWKSIDPGLLLLVFLPVLIYASAYSLDFHTFKRCFGQVLILAGPGVIIGTLILGASVKYIFPYGWDWPQCLMFGAMMSATDPVAVVALLKEVGASQKLGTVIEGESLFNDGTAYVIFLLFKEAVGGTTRSTGSSIAFFCQLALGGSFMGVVFGIAATSWLAFVFNDSIVEISITLITTYLTFYVAEDLLHISGVLAIVVLGVVMSAMASNRISPEVHEPLHVFWEMLEYFANTIIFIYSGLIIALEIYAVGNEAGEEDASYGGHIEAKEWGYAIVLYLLLQVVRGITVLSLYPALKRMGYGTNWKEMVVMVWGGLRGAVGLALALIVKLDSNIQDAHFQALVVFFMGLMAAATLLINGTSMPFLLKMLGVTRPTPAKLEVLLHVVKEVEEYGENHLTHLKHDQLLGNPDWDRVMKLTKLDTLSIIPSESEFKHVLEDSHPSMNGPAAKLKHKLDNKNMSMTAKIKHSITEMVRRTTSGGSAKQSVSVVTREMVKTDLRARLLEAVKATYGEGFEKGYIGVNAIVDLKESADRALDYLHKPLRDWESVERVCRLPPWVRFLQKMGPQQCLHLDKMTQKFLFTALESSAVLATSYVFAHREAQKGLREYIEVTGDQYASGREAEVQRLKSEISEEVIFESQEQVLKAIQFIRGMGRAFPEIIRAIKTKQASHTVLMHKRRFIDRLAKGGLIEQREWRQLMTLIKKALKKLIYTPPRLQLPDSKVLLRSHALFSDVDDDEFDYEIWPAATPCVYDKGQAIFTIGQDATHVSMVVRGVVAVKTVGSEDIREEGKGAVIGVTEVLLNQPRTRDLTALTIVEVYQIEASAMRRLIDQFEGLALRAWQTTGISVAQQFGPPELRNLDYTGIYNIFRQSSLENIPPNHKLQVVGDAVLLQGSLDLVVPDKEEETIRIEGPAMLSADPSFYTTASHVKLLNLPDNWSSNLDRVDVRSMMMLKGTSYRDRRITRTQSIFRSATNGSDGFEPLLKRTSTAGPLFAGRRSSATGLLVAGKRSSGMGALLVTNTSGMEGQEDSSPTTISPFPSHVGPRRRVSVVAMKSNILLRPPQDTKESPEMWRGLLDDEVTKADSQWGDELPGGAGSVGVQSDSDIASVNSR